MFRNTSLEIKNAMEELQYLARQNYEVQRMNQIILTTKIMTLMIIRYTGYQKQLLRALLSKETVSLDQVLIPYAELKEILGKVELEMGNTQMFPHQLVANNIEITFLQIHFNEKLST